MPIPVRRPGAIVLCGGQSRRMGSSKAWLPFGTEVLLQRVVRLLTMVADPVVVVGSPGQKLPELSGSIILVRDSIEGRGPLQGLTAGLNAFSNEVELVYVTATDAPFLQPAWVDCVSGLIGSNDLAIPEIDGQLHPLSALYRRTTALRAAEDLLVRGRFRLLDLVDWLQTIRVPESMMRKADPDLATLRNLNRPEDYDQALREISVLPGK